MALFDGRWDIEDAKAVAAIALAFLAPFASYFLMSPPQTTLMAASFSGVVGALTTIYTWRKDPPSGRSDP